MHGGDGQDGQDSGQGGGRRVVDGRFELVERLGSGGMGTVWRARDLALHREVALKEVRPPDPALSAADPTASRTPRARVLREARALARISHPNVVTIHHIVDAEDPAGSVGEAGPWLVMELLPGISLQQRLDSGPLDFREAARLGRQVLAGLRAAHAAGICHRDVKPANIMLRPDGTAVLTDFGIAALADASPLTLTGEFIGSPEFIAPERIRGATDAPAADLWSLGMLLYVAVEGLSPMRRGSTLATLAAVLDDPVPPPRLAGPLGRALSELLVRDPAARPDETRLDALLAEAEAGREPAPTRPAGTLPPSAHPSVPPPPPPPAGQFGPAAATPAYALPTVGPQYVPAPGPGPAARRRRTALVVAASVVALAVLGTGTYLLTRGDADKPRDRATGVTTSPGSPGTPGSGGALPSGSPLPTAPGTRQVPPPSGPTTASPSADAPSPSPSQPEPPPPPATPSGHWIAQLHSEPGTSGRATVDARLAAVRRQVPHARVLRSDDFAALRAGYWVIYAPGPFESGRAALAYCALHGRTTANQCVGRWLSDTAADRVYLCGPPASKPKGRCTRR
ncbi:serine/threonine-protein kinase [Streptomyces sp. NPDC051561]|uniref:serine/threonine-protein kinase n=1 Tax=Streptomyces sp. NPDC051561 TaxID=3365658 RepID=UPI0037A386A3